MSELGIRETLLVKDVMSSPVITIFEDESADKAAKLMAEHNVGCVIVATKDKKPIGIITERDMVVRIVAEDLQPSKIKVKNIMSSPLRTVKPDETLSEAARKMSRLNVRRLGVVYKGKLAGIISSKDILAVTPELIEIIQEKARIENESQTDNILSRPLMAGYCDNCGQWSDNLKEVEGNFLCEDCRVDLQKEE